VARYLTGAPSLLHDPKAGQLAGVGLFPEAIGQNPIVYEAGTEIAWWTESPNVDSWFRDYVRARYGRVVPEAEAAWTLLRGSVYGRAADSGSMETPLCARPALHIERAAPNAKLTRRYDPRDLWAAWARLAAAASALADRDTYRFDLVDLARQCLADLSIPLQRDVALAYRRSDAAALAMASQRFLDLADDLDELLATRPEFLLGRWLEEAKRWGTTAEERRQYERNARLQITVWGPSQGNAAILFDYSNRQWSGLIRGFYRPRWKMFLDYLAAQASGPGRFDDQGLYTSYGRPGDDVAPFYRALAKWEHDWTEGAEMYPARPRGDSVKVARRLLKKWAPVEDLAFERFNPTQPSDQRPRARPPEEPLE